MNWKFTLVKKIYEVVYNIDQGLRIRLETVKLLIPRYLLWYIIKFTDIINQKVICHLIDKYGWPEKSKYGLKASMTAYYVVMHSDERTIRKHIKQFSEVAKRGEADCQHVASMIDRLLKHKGKKQIYGNAIRRLKVDGKVEHFIYPISNPTAVNERRKKIGLIYSIEEYAKINDARLSYGHEISIRLTKYPSN